MRKLLVVAIIFVALSCKKNGTGGKYKIAAFPEHNGHAIKGSTLYVKFKAKSQPSDPTANYDLKIVGEADEDHVHVEDLLPGDYFLYAVGVDSTISKTVSGGAEVTIKRKEQNLEKDVHIPVME